MPTVNATHRKRLARAYAAQAGIPYMAALDAVNKAALEGRLPKRLDDAGLKAALRVLSTGGDTQPETRSEPSRFHLEPAALRLLRQVWQGRVAWERHGTRTPGFRFTIDNEPASDVKDIELRWLRDHDYFTTPPLAEGEEWAVARTTDFGDEVLATNGADTDKFHDGLPEVARSAPAGTIDVEDAWDQIRAVERGDAPSGSVVVAATGPRSLASTATAKTPKPGSNEDVRQRLERSAQISDRIAGWFKTQMNASPKPEKWEWADKDGIKDSFAEIVVTYDDGHHEIHSPGDFPSADQRLDKATDRLMGGPTTTRVYKSENRRGTANCDVCGRRVAENEPWWMVHSPGRGWEGDKGVSCGMHHPDRLPLYDTDSAAKVSKPEQDLLDLLERREGRAPIAGIVECRAALLLASKGLVRVESGSVTDEGGSGVVVLPETAPLDSPDAAGERPPRSVFIAHHGNPVARCTGTSWRAGSGQKAGEGYGPGGWNRCVKRARHESERHIDEWGNVFELDPKFRVIKNLTAGEVARIAAKEGMVLVDAGDKPVDPDLLDEIYPYKATTPDDLVEEVRARLRQNLLVQTKTNEVLKVSEVEKDSVTAQVVYPLPPRTTVRRYSYVEAATWREPSAAMVRKYEEAWGFDR